MFLDHLECTGCGARREAREPATVCPICGDPLAARYDLGAAGRVLDRATYSARGGGLWSLRELLPLDDPARAVSLGEGGTPLLSLPRLAADLGLADLRLLDEGQNPTGSFKARGMSAAVSVARAQGATALAVPSAGNAGGALAAYGARAGLPVHLCMPEDVPASNRLEAEACGAHVTLLPGTIADCGRWVRERAAGEGWCDLSTLKEPYRVEGKKSMGYELARHLDWDLPDVLLYPAGGGTGLVGIAKAIDEMRVLGWLPDTVRTPRFVAVQAAGCAPVVEAFHAGAERATPPVAPHTRASGLRVPTPLGDRWMLRVLRASGGSAVAVEDDVLLAATRELARLEGVFAAPEAGALVAALRELRSSGDVAPHERVVLVATGTGLKYAECFA